MKKIFLVYLLFIPIPFALTTCATDPEQQYFFLSVPVKPTAIFEENFSILDNNIWHQQTFSFDGNGANMRPENIDVHNSLLSLNLTVNAKNPLGKKYNGAGMGTKEFFLYGYFEVRMKPTIGSGSVASFFLMNKWQPVNWEHREIDIELLGNKISEIQMTTHDFAEGGSQHSYAATTKNLGFDYTQDFHTYGILWTPEKVEWYIDGKPVYTETRYIPNEPLQIRVNHWPGDMTDPKMKHWLGELDVSFLPSKVEYDWIRVYRLSEI